MVSFGLGQLTLQVPPWDSRDHATLYRDTLELAKLAERSGFRSFWLAEHHGSEDGYIPALLPFLAAVAARTEQMKVGTAVLLAPLHDPLRVAEDAAVVQNLSQGRLNLGMGLGWSPEEYRMFGVEMKGRGHRIEEVVEILRRGSAGERFSFEGRFFHLEDVLVSPKPAVPIPIWLGGGAPAAVERAARIGDGHFPSSTGSPATALERAKEIMAIRERLGLDGPYRFGAFLPIGIGTDADDGWARMRDGLLHVRGSYALWGMGRRDVANARDFAAQWESSVREACITGSPQQILDTIAPLASELDELGFAEVFLSAILVHPGMPFDQAAEAIETFGRAVIGELG